MQMIADQIGVTKVSVSKALNDQPGVGSELKRKIVAAAQEMGYYTDHRKTRPGLRRLEFLISKRFFLENDKFYTVIYYTIAKLCNQHNVRLSLNIVGRTDEAMLALPPTLIEDRPDGIFLCGEINSSYMAAVLKLGIPTVLIDFCTPDLCADSIIVDNFYASYCATQYLIDQGHAAIGFVGNPEFTSNIMDRYLGYVKALRMNHLPLHEDWLIINNDSSGSYSIPFTLPATLPTAFLCHCDMAAWHLMLKLRGEGIGIPEQVSLLSFDNTDLSKSSSPTLTTVDIDKERLAQLAFERMLHRLQDEQAAPVRMVMDTRLLLRDSVRPAAQPLPDAASLR